MSEKTTPPPGATATPAEPNRFVVETRSIDPEVPARCVQCLAKDTSNTRRSAFRRSDGTVERVAVVYWPYCDTCYATLRPSQIRHRNMTFMGGAQMLVVLYLVGGALGHYDIWWPTVPLLAVLFVLFVRVAKQARGTWELEWARIDDVYKGGRGSKYTFRNEEYATLFANANNAQESAP